MNRTIKQLHEDALAIREEIDAYIIKLDEGNVHLETAHLHADECASSLRAAAEELE